jgi:hypothetical protein
LGEGTGRFAAAAARDYHPVRAGVVLARGIQYPQTSGTDDPRPLERVMADPNDKPKIIVDSDWKTEARKEKERLDQESREMPGMDEIPEASFVEILQMIVMQATIGLGGFQDPQSGQRIPPNLPLARHYIDLLGLLEQKTANNLTEDEKGLVEATLHELRMAFVHLSGAAGQAGPEPEPGK